MKFKIILLISILLVCFAGCSRVPDELKIAEKLIETAPDSALHILQKLPPSTYKSGESRALYGLLIFRALDKKQLPLKPDSLLDFSIDYYSKYPDGNRLATCYLYKGRTSTYNFQYEKAVNYYLKALDETKDTKDNLLLGRINTDIGKIYTQQSDFIQAREKYKIAYDCFKKSIVPSNAYYSLINIGITYCNTKKYKTALSYFQKVYYSTNDSLTKGAALDEIGLCYYKSEEKDSAQKYFRLVINYPYLGYNKGIRYYYLSRVYFDLKEVDSAFYYAKSSLKFEPDIRTQRECYRILTNTEFLRGHLRNMSLYMNQYVQIGDSIRKIDAQIKGSYMETTHIAQKEAAKNKYFVGYLVGLVLLLIITGYILYRLLTQHNRQEKKQIQESHTEEKVGIHKKVIEDKRALLQKQIEDRKRLMMAEFRNSDLQEREHQLRNIYTELLHIDDTELFYHQMNKYLNGLISKLKNRYSMLNEKEIMLCCYILLDIPTYDMLILFGYKSDDSLKSLKRRLPKKLKLENATQLEFFILKILSEN